MRALAILGPNATEDDLIPFRAAGAEIVVTDNLVEGVASQPANAVLVLGGDGTVQRQLAGLMQAQLPLLVVAAGSANDFARALGLNSRTEALRAWTRFLEGANNVRRIDVGVIRPVGEGTPVPEPARMAAPPGPGGSTTQPPIYFCCAAGAGVDAAAARRANSLPRWLRSRGGYFVAAVAELLRFRGQRITLLVEDHAADFSRSPVAPDLSSASHNPAPTHQQQRLQISEAGILAAFANAPWYGHGMRIAPQAELDDGQLEVCFVRRTGKLRLLWVFPKVYRGRHIGLPEVEYFRAQRVCIESETPLEVHADGELVTQTPVEVSVIRSALQVISAAGGTWKPGKARTN